jgi:hypothetical protein
MGEESAMKHRNGLSVVLFVSALGCGGRLSGSATGLSEAGASGSGSSSGGETSSSSSGGGVSSGSTGLPGGSSSSGSASSGNDATSGGTCACPGGCCDTTNTCYAGVIDQLCGQSGGACIDCTASGQQCNEGVCAVPSGSSGGGQCDAACPACAVGTPFCSSAGACQCCVGSLCLPD